MSIQTTSTNESLIDSQIPSVTDSSHTTTFDSSNKALSFHSSLSRELKIRSYLISDPAFNFNPLQEFLNLTAVKIKLWNYNRLRCKTRVRFTWSVPVYASGLGIVIHNPSSRAPALTTLSSDHHLMDFGSKSTELVVEIPFINDLPFYDLAHYTDCTPFTVLQHMNVFQPYRVDTNALIDPEISVYVSLVDVEIDVPVAVNYTSKISEKLSFASKAFSTLSSIPEISLYAKVTSLALGAASSILHLLGFSRPVQPLTDHVDRSTAIGTISLNSGYLDPTASTIIDPLTNDGDVLSFQFLLKKPGFIGLMNWTQLQTVGTRLIQIPFSPISGTSTTEIYSHTPLSFVAHCFEYWRGSITYTIKFPSSPFVKGKLLLTIQNDMTEPEDFTYLPGHAYHTIIDLAEDSEFQITVPYLQSQPYTKVGGYMDSAGYILPTYFTSAINIYVYEPLIAPSSLYSHVALLYCKAHDDFEFARPSSTYKATRTSNIVNDFHTGDIEIFDSTYSQSLNSHVIEANMPDSIVYPRDVQTFYTTKIIEFPASTPTLNEEFMGERLLSCRPLLKIFDRYCFHSVDAPGTLSIPRMPLPMMLSLSTSTRNIESVTYLEYFSRIFLGSRGSVSVSFNSIAATDIIVDYGVGYAQPGNLKINGTEASAYFDPNVGESFLKPFDQHRITPAQQSIIQNVPLSTLRYFALNMTESLYVTLRKQLCAIFQLYPRSSSTTPANCTISYAAGEDFNFLFYAGIPQMYIVTPSASAYSPP